MKEVSDYMRFAINRPCFNEPDEILLSYPVLKKYKPKIDFPYKNKKVPRLTVKITDLVKFRDAIGEDIILTSDWNEDGMLEVLIYDNDIE